MNRKKRRQAVVRPTYTLLDEMAASPIRPMTPKERAEHVGLMRRGLDAIVGADAPNIHDWRCAVDAINLTETLVVTMGVAEDPSGLLQDAVAAMAAAAERHADGKPLRLDGPGIHAVRSVLDDYDELLALIPMRTFVRAYRLTERRIRDILAGKGQPHDKHFTITNPQ